MTDTAGKDEVVVTDIRMPFGSMVVFMVKVGHCGYPCLRHSRRCRRYGLEPAS
jgi:hypothetical protein